ncbi:MAG: Fe-S cluster assembly protein SufD [Salinisphaeraceae bacterium]|nr:Fe-S cluster assembly protein SufD [Salinisphaeraceae bacterium]
MTQLSPLLDHYLAEHARVERELPGAELQALQEERKAALARFVAAGFPGPRDEHWKYSDTRPLQKQAFELAAAQTQGNISRETIDSLMPEGLEASRVVFVNGHYQAALSDLDAALSLALKTADSAQLITARESEHAFMAMNQAFATDGAFINLSNGEQLEKPIYLLFIGQPGDEAQMVQLRNQIKLGKQAQATVIEHYVSLADDNGDIGYFNNCVTDIELGENASLTRIRVQNESVKAMQVGVTQAHLKRDSRLNLHSIDLGGRWVRYDTNIALAETGAEAHMDGLYVPNKRQHIDNHTCVDHLAPHCVSREDYKGILADASRGVFNGRIVVHKDAQKTDSEQSSAALLLSGKAEVDAKPELEIYADDVKCKHGATVGELDESAVFYLQSRGLSENEARNVLTYSFADELIHRIGIDALQKMIESQLLAKLPQGESLEELL